MFSTATICATMFCQSAVLLTGIAHKLQNLVSTPPAHALDLWSPQAETVPLNSCPLFGSGGQTHLLPLLACEKTKPLMWGARWTIRKWEMMPSGSWIACHRFASVSVLRWTRAPVLAWGVRTEWLIRQVLGDQLPIWSLILFLQGTFSVQWNISWPNDEHQAHSNL